MKVLAPVSLALKRGPLVFPAGTPPGYDPNSIFSRGLKLSAVSRDTTFLNLLPPGGSPLIGAVSGTPATLYDSVLGPAKNVGTSYQVTFAGPALVANSDVTLAAIFRTSAADNSGVIGWSTSGPSIVLAVFPTLTPYISTSSGDWSSGISLAANTPYFVVASGTQGTIKNINFAVTNLLTGKVTLAKANFSNPYAVTGSGFSVGFENNYSDYWQGRIAAVMAANAYFQLPELAQWAADPWSFWYPTRKFSRVGSAAGPITGTLAATEASDTSAIVGNLDCLATLAATEAPDTAAVVGNVAWRATLAATEAPDTASINGLVSAFGTLAATEASDAAAISGTVAWQAVLAATEAADTAAITGTVLSGVGGTLAATEGPDVAAIAGLISATGILVATEAPDVAAIAGFITLPGIVGVLAATEAADTAAIYGTSMGETAQPGQLNFGIQRVYLNRW